MQILTKALLSHAEHRWLTPDGISYSTNYADPKECRYHGLTKALRADKPRVFTQAQIDNMAIGSAIHEELEAQVIDLQPYIGNIKALHSEVLATGKLGKWQLLTFADALAELEDGTLCNVEYKTTAIPLNVYCTFKVQQTLYAGMQLAATSALIGQQYKGAKISKALLVVINQQNPAEISAKVFEKHDIADWYRIALQKLDATYKAKHG